MAASARKNATRLIRGALSERVEGARWLRVLRPLDLLHFEISFSGLTLEAAANDGDEGSAGEVPVLRAGSGGGLLKVRWPFQHVAEISTLLDQNGAPKTPPPDVPVAARAANRSRLVFKVPQGEVVEFSTAGILDAMQRLEMAVAPVAKPAPSPKAPWLLGALGDLDKVVAVRLAAIAGHKPAAVRGKAAAPSDLIRAGAVARRYLATGALERRPIDFEIGPLGRPPRRDPVRAPKDDETAIEAPFRLILSPSKLGAWAHALAPVTAPADPGRVELWHSRLAVRSGEGPPDELNASQRIVRAIWARDREADDSVGSIRPLAEVLAPSEDREANLRCAGAVGQHAFTRRCKATGPERARRVPRPQGQLAVQEISHELWSAGMRGTTSLPSAGTNGSGSSPLSHHSRQATTPISWRSPSGR